jgi:hypothetical protein
MLVWRRSLAIVLLQNLIETINCPPKMGNGYRASHHQRYIESIEELRPRNSGAQALFDVISDAIVTPQHDGRNQAQQFLGAFVERTIFVSLVVEREESFDAQVIAAKQLFVHFRTVTVKFIHRDRSFHPPPRRRMIPPSALDRLQRNPETYKQ